MLAPMTPMIDLDAGLFRRYDIRGLAEGPQTPLNAGAARQVGRASGTLLRREYAVTRVVVGHDNRLSSPALHAAARDGLLDSGCDVLDIGLTPTPLLYHRVAQEGDSAGLMVTGSHLPPAYNGFKLALGAQSLHGEQLQALRRLIEAGNLDSGAGCPAAVSGGKRSTNLISRTRRDASCHPGRCAWSSTPATARPA